VAIDSPAFTAGGVHYSNIYAGYNGAGKAVTIPPSTYS
jgi:hypothetical protein